VDGNKGELGVGDLDLLALALAQHPDLDVERDRGSPDALDVGIAADRVSDVHRLQESDVRDGNGDDPSPRVRGRRHLPGRTHQRLIQPPKMSPLGLLSAGIASVRDASSPFGWVELRLLFAT
jgi:hypothetical protein